MVQVVVEDAIFEEPSIILTSASPVFLTMLTREMQEAETGTIRLTDKSKSEFEVLMKFLRPRTARSMRIDIQNVDFLLKWSDEYQMEDLKKESEEFLMGLPCTEDRLLQAHQLSLRRQYDRCLKEIGSNLEFSSLEQIVAIPEIMQELMPLMQQSWKAAKRQLQVQTSELEVLKAKRVRTKEALSRFVNDLQDLTERDGGYEVVYDSERAVERSLDKISADVRRRVSIVVSRIDV